MPKNIATNAAIRATGANCAKRATPNDMHFLFNDNFSVISFEYDYQDNEETKEEFLTILFDIIGPCKARPYLPQAAKSERHVAHPDNVFCRLLTSDRKRSALGALKTERRQSTSTMKLIQSAG